MNLFNALLAKSMGGGGYPEPTGSITLVGNNQTYDVKDYAEARTEIPLTTQLKAQIQNNTGYNLYNIKCMDASGKSVADSITISKGNARDVFYPVRKNVYQFVNNAPVLSFFITEYTGTAPTLQASTNGGGNAFVLQHEGESNGSHFLVCAVICDIPSATGTVITLTAS